jgi:hypothetical protein
MRRAAMALVVLGLAVSAAAGCSLKSNQADSPGAPGQAAASMDPSVQASLADTRNVCDALGKVYSKDYGPFATALTKLATSRKAGTDSQKTSKQQAQAALKTFADDLRGATQGSANTQVRTDGAQTADQLQAHADDGTTFDKIKTNSDVQNLLGTTMKGWLNPISVHCT